MFSPINLFYILFGVFACLTSIQSVDALLLPCIRTNVNGSIPSTDVTVNNRSCVQQLSINNVRYNVSWNDGTYSILNVQLSLVFNQDRLTTVGTGTVLTGTSGLIGLPVTIRFILRDDSNGCRSGLGVSQTNGEVYLSIGRVSLLNLIGLGRWRYCTGVATLSFCPAITRPIVPVSTSTLVATLNRCYSSCA